MPVGTTYTGRLTRYFSRIARTFSVGAITQAVWATMWRVNRATIRRPHARLGEK